MRLVRSVLLILSCVTAAWSWKHASTNIYLEGGINVGTLSWNMKTISPTMTARDMLNSYCSVSLSTKYLELHNIYTLKWFIKDYKGKQHILKSCNEPNRAFIYCDIHKELPLDVSDGTLHCSVTVENGWYRPIASYDSSPLSKIKQRPRVKIEGLNNPMRIEVPAGETYTAKCCIQLRWELYSLRWKWHNKTEIGEYVPSSGSSLCSEFTADITYQLPSRELTCEYVDPRGYAVDQFWITIVTKVSENKHKSNGRPTSKQNTKMDERERKANNEKGQKEKTAAAGTNTGYHKNTAASKSTVTSLSNTDLSRFGPTKKTFLKASTETLAPSPTETLAPSCTENLPPSIKETPSQKNTSAAPKFETITATLQVPTATRADDILYTTDASRETDQKTGSTAAATSVDNESSSTMTLYIISAVAAVATIVILLYCRRKKWLCFRKSSTSLPKSEARPGANLTGACEPVYTVPNQLPKRPIEYAVLDLPHGNIPFEYPDYAEYAEVTPDPHSTLKNHAASPPTYLNMEDINARSEVQPIYLNSEQVIPRPKFGKAKYGEQNHGAINSAEVTYANTHVVTSNEGPIYLNNEQLTRKY